METQQQSECYIFLLTRPSRDVTAEVEKEGIQIRFLLTRPSRDVTISVSHCQLHCPISTHTSLAGRDRYI